MRRLPTIQKCNSTAVSQRHFFGWGGRVIVFFLIFFSVNVGFGQNRSDAVPSYEHLDQESITDVGLSTINSVVISLDNDTEGNIYAITIGGKILKFDQEGNPDGSFQLKGNFEGLVDLAINSQNEIYVAHFEGREVLAFDLNGNPLATTISSGWYKPISLTFDQQDNLYILDYNDGSGAESTKGSRLMVYKDGIGTQYLTNKIVQPLRIAVNSVGKIYISQGGNSSIKPAVLIFDENFIFDKELPDIISPGSVVVDNFDFIYVIEYANRVDFGKFLNFSELDIEAVFKLSDDIFHGIEDKSFGIKIYSPNGKLEEFYKDNIDFPVDIAFNNCSKMFVDDATIFGSDIHIPYVGPNYFIPSKLEFNLEIYQRSPSADVTPPVASCVSTFTIDLAAGSSKTITGEDLNVGSYDFCGEIIFNLSKSTFTTADEGSNTVELTVTDEQGLTSTCEVTVQVNVEDTPDTTKPVFSNCPSSNFSFSSDAGECGAIVDYNIPEATDDSGENPEIVWISGPEPGDFVEVGEPLTVVFRATDTAGNSADCTFKISVVDNESPSRVTCPQNLNFTVPFGETGRVVNYQEPTFQDNCGVIDIKRTEGPSSGEIFPLGESTVTFEAADPTGNKNPCSFTVNITEAADTEDPVFEDCPATIEVDAHFGKCEAVVDFEYPGATDNSGIVNVAKTGGADSGSSFSVGQHLIYFEAKDEAGNTATCILTIIVEDNEPPIFTDCPENITANFEISEGFEVEDYSQFFPARDYCSGNINYFQTPVPGTIISIAGDHPVVITATDASGNSKSCEFLLKLTSTDSLDLNCTREIRVPANENCEFILPNLSEEYIYFPEEAQISQSIASGEYLTEDTEVVITATYGNRSQTCIINIKLVDFTWPELTCPTIQNVTVAPSQGFTLPNYIDQIVATDNCGIVNIVQDPAPGTIVTEDVTVKITAEDTFGNFRDCFIYVYLQEEEEDFQISCPQDQVLDLKGECSIALPDLRDLASASGNATISQSPPAGTPISEETEITLTATLDGEVETCTFSLELVNLASLSITCSSDQGEDADLDGSFTLPDYRDLANVEGNCGTTDITQFPPEGTIISEDTEITLTVTDAVGDVSCNFDVILSSPEEPEPLEISCPADQTIDLEEACGFEIPDYTNSATATEGAVISQSPEAGTIVTEDTVIQLTATLNGESDFCEFEILLSNAAELSITCPSDQNENADSDGNFTLPDYTDLTNVEGNCETTDITQFPPEGTVITEDTEITLTVIDLDGNESTCTFWVNLADDTDPGDTTCPEGETDTTPPVAVCVEEFTLHLNEFGVGRVTPEIIDRGSSDNCEIFRITLSRENFGSNDIGEQEVTLTVTDASGNVSTCTTAITVVAYDPESPGLTCVDSLTLPVDESGNFRLQLNYTGDQENEDYELSQEYFSCDDLGTQSVTVTYWGEHTGTCEIDITIVDNTPPVINCLDEIDVRLNASGNATISSEDLNIEYSDNCSVADTSLSRLDFTTADIGANQVTFTATDGSGNISTCITTVNILPFEQGELQPVECVDVHIVQIGENGSAILNPRDLFTGGSGTAQFNVSRDSFTCNDLGENTITLNYTTPTEEGSCEIKIIVEDPSNHCGEPTEPSNGDYIILYPNPSNGIIRFQTSPGLEILRVEVFDMRGRFLFEKIYDSVTIFDKKLDLQDFQSGVYSILLHTNQREFLKRAIIRNE